MDRCNVVVDAIVNTVVAEMVDVVGNVVCEVVRVVFIVVCEVVDVVGWWLK